MRKKSASSSLESCERYSFIKPAVPHRTVRQVTEKKATKKLRRGAANRRRRRRYAGEKFVLARGRKRRRVMRSPVARPSSKRRRRRPRYTSRAPTSCTPTLTPQPKKLSRRRRYVERHSAKARRRRRRRDIIYAFLGIPTYIPWYARSPSAKRWRRKTTAAQTRDALLSCGRYYEHS